MYNTKQKLSNSWDGRPFGHNRHGPKSGGCYVPLVVGTVSTSSKLSPGPRPTSIPSGILINPTVCLQYTNVRERQTGRRSRSIERTVTCSGRPMKILTATVYCTELKLNIHAQWISTSKLVIKSSKPYSVLSRIHQITFRYLHTFDKTHCLPSLRYGCDNWSGMTVVAVCAPLDTR